MNPAQCRDHDKKSFRFWRGGRLCVYVQAITGLIDGLMSNVALE
jgi:hypothetical protein